MRTEEDLRRALAVAAARIPVAPPAARTALAARVRRQRAARMIPAVMVIVVGIAVGVVLWTGLGRDISSQLITNRPPERAVPTSSASPGTKAATGPSAGTRCTTRQLAVTAEQASGGANHGSVLISFRNKGAACRIGGYPGVAAIGRAGKEITNARRTRSGALGGLGPGAISPPIVDLSTGETASAILEGFNGPTDPTVSQCPTYVGLMVTPPDETRSVHLSLGFSMCSLEIHPVVPGPGGGQPVSCGNYAFRPQSSDMAANITASATTCAVARSVAAAGPDIGSANFGKSYTARRFRCTATRESQPPRGGMSSWAYECNDPYGAVVSFDRHP